MSRNKKKKFIEGYNEWSRNISKLAKNVPDNDSFEEELDKAVKEFEREWDAMSEEEREEMRKADKRAQALAKGDYSSLDPHFRKIFEKKKNKKTKPKKESDISL